MAVNWVKVIKVASTAASVLGMIGGAWAENKSNTNTITKLVSEHLSKKSK